MENLKLSNAILQKGTVVEAIHKSIVKVLLSDGSLKKIPAYSPKSRGHKHHLEEGESVVFIFAKNGFEKTLSGVRQHILNTIIYPQDENYEELLRLEGDPAYKEEHLVEIAFQQLKHI